MGVIEPELSFMTLGVAKRLIGVTTTAIVYWYNFSHKGLKVDQNPTKGQWQVIFLNY